VSADVWLVIDTGGPEPAEVPRTAMNVTYNLTPMLRAAGFIGWQELRGTGARESLPMLRETLRALVEEPARLEVHTPANGWGTRDWAIAAFTEMVAAAEAHPLARWDGWL
jgi:hypothetical protein